MRWYLFAILLAAAVWAGMVAAQRELAGLPLAPTPASIISGLREAIVPRLIADDMSNSRGQSVSIPILMYHHVQNVPTEQAGTIDWNLSISPDSFARQLALISAEGWQPITMADLAAGRITDKPIVLTFDDGYVDFYMQAWPILKQYGFNATIYVITNRLDQPGFLTSDQLVSLANAGIEIGSHSVSHPNVSKMSGQMLSDELVNSRVLLRRLTSQSISSFCYPSGEYSDLTEEAVQAAGYLTAVTTDDGWASTADIYALSRIRIKPSLSLAGLAEQLIDQSK